MIDLFRKDLSFRFIVIFTAGCLIPVIFSGVILYKNIAKNLRIFSFNQVKNNLDIRERYISTWMGDRACIISELAHFCEENKCDQNIQKRFIPAFVERSEDFSEVFLISADNGEIVFSTSPENCRKIKKDRAYFQNGLNGLYSSQIYYSPSLAGPAMTISAPVSVDGDTGLVIAARVKLGKLVEALALSSPEDSLINTYLVNKWNAFVIGDGGVSLKSNNFSLGIEKALELGYHTGIYNDWRGEDVIGSCKYIPELGAVLVSEINYSRSMRSLKKYVLSIVLLLSLAVVLSAFFFYFVLRRSLKPIAQISAAARSAADGNLSVRVKTDSLDIIGVLASSFNSMVSKLAENMHELKTSKEKQYRLIERANDGFITLDRFGNILDINPSVSKMWKYTSFELNNMLIFELFEEENARLLGRHIRRLEHDDSPGLLELSAVRKTGDSFPAEINAISLGDGTYLAIVRDVSEKKVLERELVQAQKLESVGTLSAGIAHDFDNILVGVLGAASLIKTSTDKSDPRYEMLEVIEASAERAAGLVSQLMTFARQEPPHRMPVSIAAKIEEVMRVLRSSESNSGITFRIRVASDLPPVFADQVQIEQTLFNLCTNAIDAMPAGGELTVEVAAVEIDPQKLKTMHRIPAGNYIEISISDTGTGIPEDKLDRIFEPFFTTKSPGKGTGLGLSISYGIVESHGGTIAVDSVEGVGSTFRIYLPAISGDGSCEVPFRKNVFVIDKDPNIRRLYRVAMDNTGFVVSSFPSLDLAVIESKKGNTAVDIMLIGASILAEDYEAMLFKIRSGFPNTKLILLGTLECATSKDFIATIPEAHNLKETLELINALKS